MDRNLYEDQTKSDRSIERLALCLNVQRESLQIVSLSRGYLCGALRLKVLQGRPWQDCRSAAIIMPSCPHQIEMDTSKTAAVFVLEKVIPESICR